MAKANTLPSNHPTLSPLPTAQLIELSQQRIQSNRFELRDLYARMNNLIERQREFNSMRPIGFDLELRSRPSADLGRIAYRPVTDSVWGQSALAATWLYKY